MKNLLTVALTLALFSAQGASAGTTLALAHGAVVDGSAGRAYVATATAGLQARMLEDGERAWTSAQPALPLAVVGDTLVALGAPRAPGQGRLLLLEVTDGALERSVDFDLPEGVRADLHAQPQRRFGIVAVSGAPEGALRLAWDYTERPLQGAWLATGKGETVGADMVQHSGLFDLDIGAATIAARAGEPQHFDPLVPAARRLRALGDARQFQSADALHAEASAPVAHAQLGTVWDWRLHAVAGGDPIGSVQLPVAYAPFQVSAGLLLVQLPPVAWRIAEGGFQVHERRLAALDLDDGTERWSVDLVDPEFRGVMPP